MQDKRILMVTTSHATLGDTGEATGVWLEELTTPYHAFVDAGARVAIASIRGGGIPIDPRSRGEAGGDRGPVERFMADAGAMDWLAHSLPVAEVRVDDYDAVFLPGGHGTMWDLPRSEVLASLLGTAWDAGKVVAAVCHGPAGLLNARDAAGRLLVDGRRVTGFTDSEEAAVGLAATVPFLLEARLRELGGRFESGPDFQPHALADGRLVTGQNPASSARTARLVMQQIEQQAAG
jgi:putative intracellular protease/amidase